MSEEIDLNEDIIMQIEMASYMKYNDTIASMNDYLGEMYSYSDIKDMEEAQLKYEKDLAYKSIIQLQYQLQQKENIIKEVREYIENNYLYEQDYDYDYEENLVVGPPSDETARKILLGILDKVEE